jgi:hypothetical protein
MHWRILVLSLGLVACSSREPDHPAPPTPVRVSLAEFQQLHWIVGTWQGSGVDYPAFFEAYRVLDDSTIQMRSFADSTLGVTSDSSWIEWRNGSIRSRGDERVYVAVEFTATSVRFARPGIALGGHTFAHRSTDEWTATLHPSRPGGQATVYTMRRLPR